MGNDIVDHRAATYGDPVEQYRRIALVWSGILGHEVQPFEAALMMAGLKMVRAQHTPDYSDNTDDVDGYIEIARKIVGPDMIHARSVDEYIAAKFPPVAPPVDREAKYGVHQHLVDNAKAGFQFQADPTIIDLAERQMLRTEEELLRTVKPDQDLSLMHCSSCTHIQRRHDDDLGCQFSINGTVCGCLDFIPIHLPEGHGD